MRNTYQIRKYLALAAALTVSAGLLIGCSRSDSNTQDASAGTQNTGVNASGNVVAGAGSTGKTQETSADNAGKNAAQPETQAPAPARQGTAAQTGGSQNVQNVSGTTTPEQKAQQPSAPQPAPAPSGNQKQSADADDEEDDDYSQEDFTGKFVKSDGEEAVQITLENDHLLTFVFRTSMINGSAKVEGTKALYRGDDDYTITFDSAGDMLIITVDGEDAARSGMNGIYYRDLGEDDTEDADADDEDDAYDADETELYDDSDDEFDADLDDDSE